MRAFVAGSMDWAIAGVAKVTNIMHSAAGTARAKVMKVAKVARCLRTKSVKRGLLMKNLVIRKAKHKSGRVGQRFFARSCPPRDPLAVARQ